jgi:hypothetical protein
VAWIDAGPAADVEAAALVSAPPETVFGFLADLENHWRVADRFVEVLELNRPSDAPADGGTVRVRGPLGLRRTVVTRVVAAREPRLLIGTAEVRGGTRARVSWSLAGHLESTRVRLAVAVERATPLDRLMLRLGGRRWLERRFERTLENLAAEVEGGQPPGPASDHASAVPAAS